MDCLWMLNVANIADMEKSDSKVRTCKWSQVETTGHGPGKLAYHSSVVIGDSMYLYGGSSQTSENEKLYILYMNTFEWNIVKTHGDTPGLLDEHSAVVSGRNMILFGGYG